MKPRSVILQAYAGGHLFLNAGEGFNHSGVLGGRFGFNITRNFGLELGMGYVQTTTNVPTDLGGDKVTHLINPRLDFNIYFTRARVVPYFQVGIGVKHFSIRNRVAEDNALPNDDAPVDVLPQPKNPDTDLELDAALGARILITSRFGVDLNARYLMSFGFGEVFESTDGTVAYGDRFDNMELTFGIFGMLGGPPDDRDRDGILDNDDECPDDPEDKDDFEDANGCPDPDNDKDGILDIDDECPLKPEDKDSFQDGDGCPDPDNDKDGILDTDDSCPNDPEDKDDFEDSDGCPDPDNDKDGVLDGVDKCVNVPETRNGYQDQDGCPDELPKEVERFTGIIKGINFEWDSDVLTRSSFPILNEAGTILKKFVEVRVEIQGHASQEGDDAHNLDLSQRRAESVRRYLVNQGITDDRLTAVGFGETKPIFPDTDAERPKNRRVEFHVITGGASVKGDESR